MSYETASKQVVDNGLAEGRTDWPIGVFIEAKAVDGMGGDVYAQGSNFRFRLPQMPGMVGPEVAGTLGSFADTQRMQYFGPRSWPNPELDGDWGTGRILATNANRLVYDYSLDDKWIKVHLGEPNVAFIKELKKFYNKAFGIGVFTPSEKRDILAALDAGAIPSMQFTGEPAWDAVAGGMREGLDAYIAGAIEQGKANLEMINGRVEFWESALAIVKQVQSLPTTIANAGFSGVIALIKANPVVSIGIGLAIFLFLAPNIKTALGLVKGAK